MLLLYHCILITLIHLAVTLLRDMLITLLQLLVTMLRGMLITLLHLLVTLLRGMLITLLHLLVTLLRCMLITLLHLLVTLLRCMLITLLHFRCYETRILFEEKHGRRTLEVVSTKTVHIKSRLSYAFNYFHFDLSNNFVNEMKTHKTWFKVIVRSQAYKYN